MVWGLKWTRRTSTRGNTLWPAPKLVQRLFALARLDHPARYRHIERTFVSPARTSGLLSAMPTRIIVLSGRISPGIQRYYGVGGLAGVQAPGNRSVFRAILLIPRSPAPVLPGRAFGANAENTVNKSTVQAGLLNHTDATRA